MTWPTARRTIASTAVILSLFAAPCPAWPQPSLSLADRERQQDIVDEIQQEQTENGPYSEALLDPLVTLALLYLEGGDHNLAAGAIERILQVMRANYGLTSIEQLPWIRQWIRAEEARGDFQTAWNLEQTLLDFTAKHPTDLSIVPILREVGDKRMAMLEEYEAGGFPPQITLGCYYNPARNRQFGNCHSGSRRVVVNGILSDAWRLYRHAIEVLRYHRLYSSDELRALESKLLASSYRYGNYLLGRRTLRRLASDVMQSDEPTSAQFRALVEIADWDLVFASGRAAVLDEYRRLYQRIEQDEAARAALDELFAPDTPIVLPTFAASPLETRETADSIGYIDVAFDVTSYGDGRNVEILGTSGDVTRADERQVSRLISRSVFRPRSTDGQFDEASRVTIRYYVNGRRAR